MDTYYVLGRASFRKNLMYLWAHMANNVGSALFGFIYIALWHAASHGRAVGTFSPHQLVNYIAVTQSVLWVTTFLPRDLGISTAVQTGQIAIDFSRPGRYLPRVVASALGDVAYNILFRSVPLALSFLVMGVYPWRDFLSAATDGAFAAALVLGAITGILIQYLIGMSAFWTFDTRWARRLYFTLTMFAGGQLLPIQLMPPAMRAILTWLPFQSLVAFPVSILLHETYWSSWISSMLWALILTLLAVALTQGARRRVEIQGG